MLRERVASAGDNDQLSVTRSQVPAQRSDTRVSMATSLMAEVERVRDDEER